MKVMMLTPIAGQGRSTEAGGLWECDEEEARRLIESGQAAPVKETAATRETATIEAPETAAGGKRRGKARD